MLSGPGSISGRQTWALSESVWYVCVLVPAVLIYSEETQINTNTRNREFLKVQVGKCSVKVTNIGCGTAFFCANFFLNA